MTATVIPRSMAPHVGVRTRSYSLSSGSSTASLVSVLDHDSCASLGEESDAEEAQPSPEKAPPTETVSSEKQPDPRDQKGTWEQWMVAKAKEHRERLSQETQRQQRAAEEEQARKEEKARKLKEGESKINEWIEKKAISEKHRKLQSARREHAKKEVEDAKKAEVEQKTQVKLAEWQEEKLNREKEARRKEREKKRKEQEEKEAKQKKCQAAYDEWYKKAQRRPKSAHSSLGYTSGKLTGYYDTSAHPVPSYVNPNAWIPVEIPRQKTVKKKPKTNTRKWDPNKYF